MKSAQPSQPLKSSRRNSWKECRQKPPELENQLKMLETLLANYEIQHVAGEIDDDIYQREINLLSTGLETTKNELETIKTVTTQLSTPATPTVQAPAAPEPVAPAIAEVAEPIVEAAPAPVIETPPQLKPSWNPRRLSLPQWKLLQ